MSEVRNLSTLADEVKALVMRGRILDGWELAKESGVELAKWPAGKPLREAARLSSLLGDNRLGRVLDAINWRHNREDPEAYFMALFLRSDLRPMSDFQAEITERLKRPMSDEIRGDLLAHQAWQYAVQHDFTRAYEWINRALELRPEDAWMHVQHSRVLEAHDRYAEALEAAERACRLEPGYRHAEIQRADILIHLGRDDEALEHLLAAHASTQQAALPARMQVIYSEREDHAKALWCLEEIERLSPLANKKYKQWIAARRADFLYMAGDLDGFLTCCDQAEDGFHKKVAENVRLPGAREKKRVRLSVPFVRQHRMTCAPATLSALAAFWGRHHDHREIADAICHHGTPWHKERQWVESHGFVAREFKLTPEILHGLIDRGLPFTLTTQWTTGAHLQACIGYDDRTGVVLVRDPTQRHFVEGNLEGLLKEHPIDGPRCMVMVPEEEASRLDGLVFPMAAAYDAHFDLLKALDGHDRLAIDTALTTLRAVAPDSLLALYGEARVAALRDDTQHELKFTDQVLERAPGLGYLLMRKSYLLAVLGRRRERRELLIKQAQDRSADPVFISELGELLIQDARELPLAEYYLRRALRRRPQEGRCYESMARCRDKQNRYEEGRELHRAAACLVASNEGYAGTYFDACCITGSTREGLEFLRGRTADWGRKDSGPWITLASKLSMVHSDHDAIAVLEEARRMLPDDAGLLVEASRLMTFWGATHRDTAHQWLEEARGRVAESDWLPQSARLSLLAGDRPLAIRRWRALLDLQPLNRNAWSMLARLVAEEDGERAALELLEKATAAHPDQTGLWSLRVNWLTHRPAEAIKCLDRMLEADPQDAWAYRERARFHLELGRPADGLPDAREALALQPYEPTSHGMLGWLLLRAGQKEEGHAELRNALRLGIDYVFAARQLVLNSGTRQAMLEALYFIETEMRRQVSDGEIVPVYQELAWRFVEPQVLAETLREFCRERPDLWQTWAACVDHALQMRDGEWALSAAESLTENFPLLPGAWMNLSRVHHEMGRYDLEEKALSRALDLSPGWDTAARRRAEVLERLGRIAEAEQALRKALADEPLEGRNYGVLADFLQRAGRHQEAVALLVKANEAAPLYEWAWEMRAKWARSDGAIEPVEKALREASERFGHRRSWWVLASDIWAYLGKDEESLAAIHKGLELDPLNQVLRDTLACRMADAGKFDEALAACERRDDEELPRELEGRRAWLLMASGQPVKAIATMQELLKREPDYAWGTSELAGWLDKRGEWEQLRTLARHWARIAPEEIRAFGYLGRAERQCGDAEAAREAYQHAYFLDPQFVYAGRQLADLQMELKRFDEAAETLRTLRHFAPGVGIECDLIELDLKRGKRLEALEAAKALFDHQQATPAYFGHLSQLMKDAAAIGDWNKVIRERVGKPPVKAPGALAAWLAVLPVGDREKKAAKAVKRILAEPADSPARIEGWNWLIDDLGERQQLVAIRHLASKHRAELHGKGQLWAAIGRALLRCRKADLGVKWLSDWRSRQQDWSGYLMVILAALYEGASGPFEERDRIAEEARREGLARFPNDGNGPALRAGLALQEAIHGRIAASRELLGQFESGLAGEYYQALANFAQSIVAAAEGREKEASGPMIQAVEYSNSQVGNASLKAIRERAEKAAASHLPWTKGKVSILRKKWGLKKSKTGKTLREGFGDKRFILLAVVIILQAIARSCSDGHH